MTALLHGSIGLVAGARAAVQPVTPVAAPARSGS